MACCDTCPLSPTCEEIEDFARDALGMSDDYAEEYARHA
jgi:hypothetical protein